MSVRRCHYSVAWRVLGLVVASAAGCAPPRDEWLGLNVPLGHTDYGGQWVSAKAAPEDREIYVGLTRELGVRNVRDLFMSWHRVQPQEQQPPDYSVPDDLARRYGEAGVDVLALCWVIPSWAAAEPSEAGWSLGLPRRDRVDAFTAFVSAFVERYDGDGKLDMPGLRRPVRCYEFMSDMEEVPAAEYAFWLQKFHQAVKRADPKARVVIGSLGSPGLKSLDRPRGNYDTFFDRLLACPELAGAEYPYFDAVAFKNYPANYPGRKPFAGSLDYLRLAMEKHRAARPVWLTEFGVRNLDESPAALESQASGIVKLAVEARALGVERAYLHCLWDYRFPGRPDRLERYGLVGEASSGRPPERKPSFGAFRLLCREVLGHDRVRRVQDGIYAIEDDRDTRYVAWREESYAPPALGAPLRDGWWRVLALDGTTRVKHGTELLPLGPQPVFLSATGSPFLR